MKSTPPRWHPILGAVEEPVGVWTISIDMGVAQEPYLVIRIVRRGEEVGYRVDAAPTGNLVGYYRTLLAAAAHGHTAWIATRAYGSAPNTAAKPNPWSV